MAQLLSLSRAARLAGVTRAEIQKRIRHGELTTFEGEIAVSDLLRVYPSVSLEKDDALERVERIKARALPKSHEHDSVLPSPEVLVSRLKSLSQVLTEKVSALDATEELLDDLGKRLDSLIEGADPETAGRIRAVIDWLAGARRELLDHPQPDNHARLVAKDTFLRIMAANVKIIPSGHEFFVEGTETILEASIRAGLKVAYGCSSGNCGACKARVVSGEVWKTREHDYVLSAREKQMGYILACSNTAVTDVVLEAAEAFGVDDLPHQEIRAILKKKERLDENLLHLQVQTPRTQTLRFMAGQRARLGLEDGSTAELPIASCPCNGRNLHFFVRRKAGDAFCQTIFGDAVTPGEMINVDGPRGQFVLDEESPDAAVFVAVGDGIAPVKSLIEHAVSIDLIESFHLYWAVPDPEGQYQARWCRAMKESLDNFFYTPLIDVSTQDLLVTLSADHTPLNTKRFYMAGPESQIAPVARGLEGLGVASARISMEAMD
jgi:CDP-4-dehydro-6-deoxyglucose reductase